MTNAAAVREAVAQGFFCSAAAGASGVPTILHPQPRKLRHAPLVHQTMAPERVTRIFVFWSTSSLQVQIPLRLGSVAIVISRPTILGFYMAKPHVTGLGAYILALEGYKAPAALCSRILDLSIENALSRAFLSGNRLAYNGNGA